MESTATTETKVITAAALEDLVEQVSGVPSFTIQADSTFGIRCMIAVRNLALELLPRDEQRVIAAKLREFDLYEEENRGRAKVAK